MKHKITKADRRWVMDFAHGYAREENEDFGKALSIAWGNLYWRKRHPRIKTRPAMQYDYTERKELELV